ncbi:polymorphic toxin type 44 domain-containing protein [Saccharopolyspora sp. NFXS83]|uniref:polymorphic toxin type 44 domain-containing protein n=1 Tax=Saccharopolyspora sp. NFXS83 TaxID=2993560 RepID=UPI00224AFA75|nr:polymorphic toxin type 44 domain-containing protein [Saccharopolyspora sp. NFXS83]MCX2730089.1 polymorphic toxin type 44 domain-containing protein [Saccharopolyspora sp. NFXS83]
MLSYDDVRHAPLEELASCVSDWTDLIGKLKTLDGDIHETVLKPVQTAGWQGDDAQAGIAFIDETAKEFGDAAAEATGIRDILREAHDAIKKARDRLVEIADVDAPAKDLVVNEKGEVRPKSAGPGADVAYRDQIDEIKKEIERALIAATEADENAAFALKSNVDEKHDFNAPEQPTLAAAEAAESEARFRESEKYIYDEMMRNRDSDTTEMIKELLRPKEWYEFGRDPGGETIAALAMWGNKVRPGAEWDHKPLLEEKFGLDAKEEYQFKVPGENRTTSYDIWSNIHYGYVGRAAGIDEETLIEGASIGEGVGEDDQGDQLTMRAGIEIYDKYGDDLTPEQFHTEVMKTINEMEAQNVEQVQEWQPRKY